MPGNKKSQRGKTPSQSPPPSGNKKSKSNPGPSPLGKLPKNPAPPNPLPSPLGKLSKNSAPPNPLPTPSNPSGSSKSVDSSRKTDKIVKETMLAESPPGLDGIQTALKGMADQKNKLTAKIAELELSVLMETAENDDELLVVALKNKLVKIAELEKRYMPGGEIFELFNSGNKSAEVPTTTPVSSNTSFVPTADVFIPTNSTPTALNGGNPLLDFSNMGNDVSFNSAVGRSLKIPMPRMDSNYEKCPDVFVRVLEDRLKADGINQAHWKTYLCAALEYTRHGMWFNKSILFSKQEHSWEDMKKLVIDKYSLGDKKQLALKKLTTIKQGADESASNYINRFIDLKYDAELEDDDASALYAFGQGETKTQISVL